MALAFKGSGSASTAHSATANQATFVVTTATTTGSIGDFAVLCYAVDNTINLNADEGAVISVTDSAGNKWIKAIEFTNAAAAQTAATCGIWYSNLTATLATSSTITLTYHTAASRDASAANLTYFTKAAGTFAMLEGSGTLANDAAGVGSLNVTTSNIECLRIRAIATESTTATALTKTAAFTAVLQQAISTGVMAIRGEYLISTGTSQASAPTLFTADHASVYVAFRESPTFVGVETSKHINSTSASVAVTSFTTALAPGQIIVGVGSGTGAVTSVTASGLTFTARSSITSAGGSFSFYSVWVAPYTSNFSGTITVNFAASNYNTIDVMAVTGVDSTAGIGSPPFDANGSLPGVNTASGAPTGTTSNANDFVFCVAGGQTTGSATVPWILMPGSGALEFLVTEYQVVKATGTFTPDGSGGIFDALMAATAGTSGTLAVTEIIDVAALVGQVLVSGALSVTTPADIALFNGNIANAGTFASIEASDVAGFFGSTQNTGTFSSIEAKDVLSFNVNVASAGTLASIEARDVAVFIGNIANTITGILLVNEAGINLSNNIFLENASVNTVVGALTVVGIDAVAFNGSVTGVAGTLAVTEAQDQASFLTSILPAVTGVLAANEAGILISNETFIENSVTNTVIGTLTIFGIDTVVFNGFVGVSGVLGSTETADAAAFAVVMLPDVTAVLAVTETPDNAVFGGTVFNVISAQLAATEIQDGAAFAGAIFNIPTGQLVVIEASDTAIFSGTVTGIAGQLSVIEAADLANFIGSTTQPVIIGDLIVIESADIAHFTGTVPLEDDSDFENWKFGHRFDRSLTCRFPWQGGAGLR